MMEPREIIGDFEHHRSLDLPASVRTPGRTWTEFPESDMERGEGELEARAPDGVQVMSLAEAHEEFPGKVKEVLFRHIDPGENALTSFHASTVEDSIFLRVPGDTRVEEPVRIVSEAREGIYPHHVLVYAEGGSSLSVFETNRGDPTMDSSMAEAVVGDGANLDYVKLNDLGRTTGYSENRARVDKNGTMNWMVLSAGGDLYKNGTRTVLASPGSGLHYRLGFLATGEQHMDLESHVVHGGDNTRCNMDSRGVAMGSSRTVYKGVQEVGQNAEGTRSFQDEKTVMIGEECEADTSPQLRIDNNDVEATHAATTGHIDEKDLYYMKSRGLRKGEAVREIVSGMFEDLLGEEGNEEEVRSAIERKIAEGMED